MADPRGTYSGPSERGLATVLPSGPNFLALAATESARRARADRDRQLAKDRADALRDKQVDRAMSLLSKPVPSDQMYQESVDRMKSEALDRLSKMDLEGADAGRIRHAAAEAVQDLVSYATAGKQLATAVGKLKNAQASEKYKTLNLDMIQRDLISKVLVGEDGNVKDPRQIDPTELNLEKLLYESGEGVKYLNPDQVLQRFLNSESMKEASVEIETKMKERRAGRFIASGSETVSFTGKPFLDFDPVTGNVSVKDGRALVEGGILQVALNDRQMALLLTSRVDEFFEGRETKPTDEERTLVMGEMLADMLEGNTGGTDYSKKLEERFRAVAPLPSSSGGGNKDKWAEGTQRWVQDATSSDLTAVHRALQFADKDRGISDEATSALSELAGVDPTMKYKAVMSKPPAESLWDMATDPQNPLVAAKSKRSDIVWALFEDPNGFLEPVAVPIDRKLLGSELAIGAINDIQSKIKYKYGDSGRLDAPQPAIQAQPPPAQSRQPGRLNKRNR